MSSDFSSKGTVVIQRNGKTFWFKDEWGLQGQQVPLLHVTSLVEAVIGRKLRPGESGLLISKPLPWDSSGSPVDKSITIVSMLVADALERNPLKMAKREVIGYIVRYIAPGVNHGHVREIDAFYDTDGEMVGEPTRIYQSEPGLEAPLIDPIDFVGGILADLVRAAGRALLRAMIETIEEKLLARGATPELAKLAALTVKELKAVRGGAVSAKPPLISADALNKPVPQIKLGMGPKRPLDRNERAGVMKILNVLERVRGGDGWAWAELVEHRLKQMQFDPWRRLGWNEIDVLAGNAGWANQMRVLVRWVKGEMEVKLMQMH